MFTKQLGANIEDLREMGATVLKLSTGGDLRLDSQDLEGPIGKVVLSVRRERRQILARRRDRPSHLARFDMDLAHRSVLGSAANPERSVNVDAYSVSVEGPSSSGRAVVTKA